MEINYRVWYKNKMYPFDEGTWESLHIFPNGSVSYNRHIAEDDYDNITDKCVVMLYTGLKDKEGNKIFDHDIVEFLYKHPEDQFAKLEPTRCEIVWHPEGAWCLKWLDKKKYLNGARLNPGKYTVIGNAFKNPELLKVK